MALSVSRYYSVTIFFKLLPQHKCMHLKIKYHLLRSMKDLTSAYISLRIPYGFLSSSFMQVREIYFGFINILSDESGMLVGFFSRASGTPELACPV